MLRIFVCVSVCQCVCVGVGVCGGGGGGGFHSNPSPVIRVCWTCMLQENALHTSRQLIHHQAK